MEHIVGTVYSSRDASLGSLRAAFAPGELRYCHLYVVVCRIAENKMFRRRKKQATTRAS